MGVVGPHDHLGVLAVELHQAQQGVEHVAVAQVPTVCSAVVHDAVVQLGISDEPRVLLGFEPLLVDLTVLL